MRTSRSSWSTEAAALCLCGALAVPAGTWAQGADAFQQRYTRGLQAQGQGDCKAAILEFDEAYKIRQQPRVLYNIAQCHAQLGHDNLALRYYRLYLQREPKPKPGIRTEVEAQIGLLEARVASLEARMAAQEARQAQPQPPPPPPSQPQSQSQSQSQSPPQPPPQPQSPPQPQPLPPPPTYQPAVQPPAYREQPRVGLIVAGASVFGGVYMIHGVVSALTESYLGLIPLAGPFLQMPGEEPGIQAILAFDGVVQAGGVTMLILGAVLKKRVPVSGEVAGLKLRLWPGIGPTGRLTLSGSF